MNNSIEEQTGYSNSPKFSIYRLNNQSQMKDGQMQNFEDQFANIYGQHELVNQSANQDVSQFIPPPSDYYMRRDS